MEKQYKLHEILVTNEGAESVINCCSHRHLRDEKAPCTDRPNVREGLHNTRRGVSDACDFRWRRFQPRVVRFKANFGPFRGPLAASRRTHPRTSCSNVRRTIHRLDSANSVCNCAVFLASPR